MDNLTKEQRRKNMQAIKSKDTIIELKLRKALWQKGYRYRINYNNLPGRPDIVFTKKKIAIFCDSEFWHGYDWRNRKERIKSNRDYWIKKIERNIERDRYINQQLESQGWQVLRFWGREIQENLDYCISLIEIKFNSK
jgi:DNA mismatch endonuclease (patch repair protein)